MLLVLILTGALVIVDANTQKIDIQAPEGTIKVACVGDSITYGPIIRGRKRNSYPAQLQTLLGEDYYVINFGANGHAVQLTADKPYRNNEKFQLSLDFEPDIVFLMIGTNDTREVNRRPMSDFIPAYYELLDFYKNLPSSPRIFLMTPPAVFLVFGLKNPTYHVDAGMVKEIAEIVRNIAADEELDLIDIYALTEDKPEAFPFDGVHNNIYGASLIADACSTAIKNAA